MPQLPNNTPADFRARVWEQMYEQLFKDLCAPTAQEMMDGLAVRRTMPDGKHKVVTPEMFWAPKPSGWAWERFKAARDVAYEEDRKGPVFIAWDLGFEHKPIRLPTEEDRAVHRAIAAMQQPTRANEL